MKRKHIIAIVAGLLWTDIATAQDTLWVRYTNRFTPNASIVVKDIDSLEFNTSSMKLFKNDGTSTTKTYSNLLPTDQADLMFTNPGR